ncbi:3-hydroxybutyrate dehydrogenase [Kiloniella laminariae]|uniref:3-hydroxybutyrate dehydrogenase n=1 Tax=Kiloniella laminariae TaxID=454162 RepID=UPI000377A0EA|nr:3-hydroxybutyrate dehydrogenase [Kiloniella laminariae]
MSILKGKAAVVTGSTSGIGKGIAEQLAAEGADIMLNGFGDQKEIRQLEEDLARQYGVRVAYSDADMTKPDEIVAMIKKAESIFGAVDIVVNNAGIQHVCPIDEFPADRWDAVIAINLTSAFHTIKAALPMMKQKGWGRIINVASAHGLSASANKSAYVAAKHGIVGLTKAVALEVATQGITSNAICPGWVLTDLVRGQIEARAKSSGRSFEEEKKLLVAEKTPTQDFSTPEQIGKLAVFLCSDAASQMTGAPFSVDGGWMAQ